MRPISRIDSFCDYMNNLMQEAGIVSLMKVLIKIREIAGYDIFFPEEEALESYAYEAIDEMTDDTPWTDEASRNLTRFWKLVACAWKAVPDWRFGQLITNFMPLHEDITNDMIVAALQDSLHVEPPLCLVTTYDALPCSAEIFEVKGVEASTWDFGRGSSESDGEYGCAYHEFISYDEPKEGVLEKYKITLEEYQKICDRLERALYVGHCGWCS